MSVIDLGYRTGPLDEIDAAPVAGWRAVLTDLTARSGPDPVIGHPTTWGAVRVGVLAQALAELEVGAVLLPRAVLIAQSHADTTAQRCLVVETTHLPRPAPDFPHGWDLSILERDPAGWRIVRSEVRHPDSPESPAALAQLADDSVAAVFVDGDDPDDVADAVDWLTARIRVPRVVAVDRDLVVRHGLAVRLPDWCDVEPLPTPPPRFRTRWALAAAAAAVAVILAILSPATRSTAPAAAEDRRLAVAEVDVPVPADWELTELPELTGPDAGREDAPARTVVADRDDGRRLIIVATDVRAGSTLSTVAASLDLRLGQRGATAVTEFSPATRFAGREVISYRETPVSGPPVRWYVQLVGATQVSIGCQAGETGEAVDEVCRRAVSGLSAASR